MKKFEPERVNRLMLNIPGFKYPIPFVSFAPISENEQTVVFLYLGGLGCTIPFVEIMNYPFFDHHYLLTFERASHGKNLNHPKRWPSYFIDELKIIVNKAHKMFPDKKIYLLGES
jgi:hypothetical protein